MKRLIALIFAISLTLVFSCCSAEQQITKELLVEKDGVYTITLPKSNVTLKLREDEERFIPYINDELIENAEIAIIEKFGEIEIPPSNFYIDVYDDYLCLGAEVIKYVDEPNENVGCFDHEHIMHYERISTEAVE
ncbi:MAG: hypothetical protein IIX67_01955 [Clostridia bacterium]|nr:hypothetical protein [Clostridia bacterium]